MNWVEKWLVSQSVSLSLHAIPTIIPYIPISTASPTMFVVFCCRRKNSRKRSSRNERTTFESSKTIFFWPTDGQTVGPILAETKIATAKNVAKTDQEKKRKYTIFYSHNSPIRLLLLLLPLPFFQSSLTQKSLVFFSHWPHFVNNASCRCSVHAAVASWRCQTAAASCHSHRKNDRTAVQILLRQPPCKCQQCVCHIEKSDTRKRESRPKWNQFGIIDVRWKANMSPVHIDN